MSEPRDLSIRGSGKAVSRTLGPAWDRPRKCPLAVESSELTPALASRTARRNTDSLRRQGKNSAEEP